MENSNPTLLILYSVKSNCIFICLPLHFTVLYCIVFIYYGHYDVIKVCLDAVVNFQTVTLWMVAVFKKQSLSVTDNDITSIFSCLCHTLAPLSIVLL